jgi:outer membrane protein
MKHSIWILILCSLLCSVLTALVVLRIVHVDNRKIAVVDAIRLFNEYKMKQELEGYIEPKLRHLSGELDSLTQEIRAQRKSGAAEKEVAALYRAAAAAQQQLNDEYQQSNQQINEQVWKRLNPLIDEYGSKNGLRLIIGANGMGSVLYHDQFYDHTSLLIDFVNTRYAEGD